LKSLLFIVSKRHYHFLSITYTERIEFEESKISLDADLKIILFEIKFKNNEQCCKKFSYIQYSSTNYFSNM